MNWHLKDIVAATGGRLLYGAAPQGFRGIGIDSRTIGPGELFVAIRGTTHDGHGFVPQVAAKGVRGIVVEEQGVIPLDHGALESQGVACVAVSDTTRALGALAAFLRRRMQIPVVAITGSNGKTTTRKMTDLVMGRQFNTLATEGNLNNEIGLPLTLFRLTDDHQAAVLELGMNHPGEIDRLGAICHPTIGVITNVGPAHLEFFGSVPAIARAKAELLAHIHSQGYAVLNKDDGHVAALASQAACRVLYFGTSPEADVRAEAVVESTAGVHFQLILPHDRLEIALRSPGRFMVSNALAAAAAAFAAGVDSHGIKTGLESFSPVKGRLDVIAAPNQVHIVDDTYNANPLSMAAAMQTLTTLRGSSRGFIVLGDMLELGDGAPELHRQVGAQAGETGAVKLYAYGQYARDVLAGARRAGMAPGRMMAADKEEIVADLLHELQPGDWVLVKGSRGMAMETVVAALLDWARKDAGQTQGGRSKVP
jgi:UDP-N-acetylmuramoyl-tripeptide--D-alanyl-D-alanine ligase